MYSFVLEKKSPSFIWKLIPEWSGSIFSNSFSFFSVMIGVNGNCEISSSRNLTDSFLLHPEIVIADKTIKVTLRGELIVFLLQFVFT
ncbi:MAG TPA: hypothetical protein DCE22_10445 [Verrucomicrobiales bacterium]|nr:hypothetical protein [Verrucomicrobiales bacterium]